MACVAIWKALQLGKSLSAVFTLSALSPARLCLGAVIVWPVFVGSVYLTSSYALGSAPLPFTPARFAWTVLTNGVLFGLLLAGHHGACRSDARGSSKYR